MLRPRYLRDNSLEVLSRCVLLKLGGGSRFQIYVLDTGSRFWSLEHIDSNIVISLIYTG